MNLSQLSGLATETCITPNFPIRYFQHLTSLLHSPYTLARPENQYLAPQVPQEVLQMSATMVVRFLLMVRLLVGGMTVPLEEVCESSVLLIMHGR